jgi:hypothetical protein
MEYSGEEIASHKRVEATGVSAIAAQASVYTQS